MEKAAEPIDLTDIPEGCRAVVRAICDVGRNLSRIIARGEVGQKLGEQVGRNSDGDGQKALDILADEAFAQAMRGTGVRYYGSEERDSVVELDASGTLALAIDPLDGSSNIDANVSIGTIFSIYPAAGDGAASLLRKASDQIAAGYIIYGPQTSLAITFGDGTRLYTLDPDSRSFVLTTAQLRIPDHSRNMRSTRRITATGRPPSGPISMIAWPARKGRMRAITTCAGLPRWWRKRTGS